MGLLEKAGQMESEEAKPKKAKASAQKKKAKPTPKPRRSKKKSDDLDDLESTPKVARTLPPEFTLARKPARFARSLVDFIVTFGWAVPIVGIMAYGSDGDFTYFIIAGAALFIFNVIAMPIMTQRTVGNYASLTRYVNSKGNSPVFLHQTLKSMTVVYVAIGLFLIASAGLGKTSGVNAVNMGIGFAFLAIPLTDWIVAKIRHETRQGLWDSMFFAYMVTHTKPADGDSTGFFGRLESSGDWLKEKGWLGSEEESDD